MTVEKFVLGFMLYAPHRCWPEWLRRRYARTYQMLELFERGETW